MYVLQGTWLGSIFQLFCSNVPARDKFFVEPGAIGKHTKKDRWFIDTPKGDIFVEITITRWEKSRTLETSELPME